MKRKLVIGNWKMNGDRQANAQLLDALQRVWGSLREVDIAIFPPYPYLAQVAELLTGTHVQLGAQNLDVHGNGAFTGEVSSSMLLDLACRFVLVGHSERRALFAESDAQVARKYAAALHAGLVPVLCVGETLEQRCAEITEQVVTEQILAVLQQVGVEGLAAGVIAYEPVWAIGTGETATPTQAQAVHRHIRTLLAEHDSTLAATMSILYGGSVKAGNAGELFAQGDIDGGLIGGASLDAASFAAICRAARP